jgi:hypothetical protein
MRYEKVHVCVDDGTIARGNFWAVLDPVWWTANIYDGPEQYELSLLQFSRSQRLLFALSWYCAEVNNGGHRQFYSNSTGIVWKDALEAFRAIDSPECAGILEESAQRLGGSPSLDRHERAEQLQRFKPNFRDLDDRFYATQKFAGVDEKTIRFIRTRPSDFYFDGTIRRAILPRR